MQHCFVPDRIRKSAITNADREIISLAQKHTKMLPYYWRVEDYVKWKISLLPDDLTGKTVIDIGSNEGVYAFAAERRGAARILCVENEIQWLSCFNKIKHDLGSRCEFRLSSLDDIEEKFDVCIYYDVYYHLDNPMAAFHKIRSITKEYMLFCGHMLDSEDSVARLLDPGELHPLDSTNIWAASLSCIKKMMQMSKFAPISAEVLNKERVAIKAMTTDFKWPNRASLINSKLILDLWGQEQTNR